MKTRDTKRNGGFWIQRSKVTIYRGKGSQMQYRSTVRRQTILYTDPADTILSKLWETVEDRGAW